MKNDLRHDQIKHLWNRLHMASLEEKETIGHRTTKAILSKRQGFWKTKFMSEFLKVTGKNFQVLENVSKECEYRCGGKGNWITCPTCKRFRYHDDIWKCVHCPVWVNFKFLQCNVISNFHRCFRFFFTKTPEKENSISFRWQWRCFNFHTEEIYLRTTTSLYFSIRIFWWKSIKRGVLWMSLLGI